MNKQIEEIINKTLVVTNKESIKTWCVPKIRSFILETLEEYSMFLEQQGYTDTDWRAEQPYAIDEFLKSKREEKPL